MKKNIQLEKLIKSETAVLSAFRQMIILNGQNMSAESNAVVLMWLKESVKKYPHLIKEPDARLVFKHCSKSIKGSEFEHILLPKPKTESDYAADKVFKKSSGIVKSKISKYEYFFNEIFPYLDL